MDRLKAALMAADQEAVQDVKDRVEVVGLTIASCLNKAAEFLRADLTMMDYEILEKGKKSFLNPVPYRILVSLLPEDERYKDLEEFSIKLGVGDRLLKEELNQYIAPKHKDGKVLVRVHRSGVALTVFPALGEGRAADLESALTRIRQSGVTDFDMAKVERTVREAGGEPIKIANYIPKPDSDSTCKVEISHDEMKATVKITPPKPGGRHLEVGDVVQALKVHGVVIGFQEDAIRDALIEDKYMQEIVAAQGVPPKHGQDAQIDYKVAIKKHANLEEDASGRIDFKQLNLVENVVVGQILAEKIPATRGVIGRTLTNRLVDARDGKDVELKQGRGTILSEDRMKLIAEINGQVVYSNNRVSVEPLYRVVGDVGPKTGNILFLGSVVIGGNVLDGYEVKAAGNVEIGGHCEKARIEAEGDIVVRAGVLGREGAYLESSGGSLYGKFVQSATIVVAENVTVQEGILHSKVDAGGKIVCNGRRAQIVGGRIRATKEVRAKTIGSAAGTPTEIIVGTDPRILSQFEELTKIAKETEDNLKKTQKIVATLDARQKADPDNFTGEQESELSAQRNSIPNMETKLTEVKEEVARLEEHMNALGAEGKVHAEKEILSGAVVTIKDASQVVADSYRSVTLTYDNGYIKVGKLEKDEDQSRGPVRRR